MLPLYITRKNVQIALDYTRERMETQDHLEVVFPEATGETFTARETFFSTKRPSVEVSGNAEALEVFCIWLAGQAYNAPEPLGPDLPPYIANLSLGDGPYERFLALQKTWVPMNDSAVLVESVFGHKYKGDYRVSISIVD